MARSAASPSADIWDRESVPDAATSVVKRIEGFSAKPYDDNGAKPGGTWTIGYGTIMIDGVRVSPKTPPITEARAVELLMVDMAGAAAAVARRVLVPLKTAQAAALISWTYNLGEGNLSKSTLLRKVNARDWPAVPNEMRKWINQEGKPLVGLLRRRWAEAAIFQGMEGVQACVRAWNEIDDLGDWPAF